MDLNPETLYLEEAHDLLNELEENLLELEEDPSDAQSVDSVFRSLHTIKGGASMFDYQQLADFMHHLENVFDSIREGDLDVSQAIVDFALKSKDHIKVLLDSKEPSAEVETRSQQLLQELSTIVPMVNETADDADCGPVKANNGLYKKRI